MDHRSEARSFLIARRGRIAPDHGALAVSGRRRVQGLRRSEVAQRAGISTSYYTHLERGHLGGASPSVLDAVSRALVMSPAEREHLFDLAGVAAPPLPRGEPSMTAPDGPWQRILDDHTSPAWLSTTSGDIVATNRLARLLNAPLYDDTPGSPVNFGRFIFLRPDARWYFTAWPEIARQVTAFLRMARGRAPSDRATIELVALLRNNSPEFRALWEEQDVRSETVRVHHVRHPTWGDLAVDYQAMHLARARDLTLFVCLAESEATTRAFHYAAAQNMMTPAPLERTSR